MCVAATGTDNVDLAAARQAGIAVSNARDYATASVAEAVFAMLLTLVRQLDRYRAQVAAGAWSARLLRPLGLHVPLTSERGYHLEFDLPDDQQPVTAPVCPVSRGFYFTPMTNRLRVAGTVELGGTGSPPSPHRLASVTGSRSACRSGCISRRD